jgi:ribosome assembly protein RRB1
LFAQPNGFQGSGGSVEDLQWSPTEDTVFASCGVDQHLRVWDIRTQRQGIAVKAHDADINVISWNRTVSYMMISGCDDGSFKIWDLRNFKPCVGSVWMMAY